VRSLIGSYDTSATTSTATAPNHALRGLSHYLSTGVGFVKPTPVNFI
jgi:hypothetical protein